MKKFLAAFFIVGIIFSGKAVLNGDTIPTITLPKKTVKVKLKVQPITVTRHDSVVIDAATVDSWMTEGNKALQKKDSASDVACAVKLQRSGAITTFSDPNFLIIDSEEKYNALRSTVTQRVKIVQQINWCGRNVNPGEIFLGCGDTPGTHIVIISAPSDALTLVHEFGHNQGLPHVTDSKKIMNDSAPVGKEVDGAECAAFKQ